MLVDSHCHLHYFAAEDIDNIVQAAQKNGVEYLLSVCTSLENFAELINITEKYQNVYISVGIHPSEVLANEPTVTELAELAQHPKVVAIGETGLDYHYDSVPREIQQQRFRTHIQAAKQVQKPLIVHTREASVDILQIMQQEKANQVGGVMHCFTESWEVAQQALALNFYISFAGIITFKNAASLREVAQQVPLDKILVETDAPYLAPVPFRGKQNQPAYVIYMADLLAELKKMPKNALYKQICANFTRLFNIKIA